MDETENRAAVVLPKQPVARGEGFDKAVHAVQEILLAFSIVMDVDVHVGDALARHHGQCVQNARAGILPADNKRCIGGGRPVESAWRAPLPANAFPTRPRDSSATSSETLPR